MFPLTFYYCATTQTFKAAMSPTAAVSIITHLTGLKTPSDLTMECFLEVWRALLTEMANVSVKATMHAALLFKISLMYGVCSLSCFLF